MFYRRKATAIDKNTALMNCYLVIAKIKEGNKRKNMFILQNRKVC
jgi:hypothetical protein